MIDRLYIDNFRCFSSFEWHAPNRALLVGRNGSGKSSLLEVLWKLRQYLSGQADTETLFPQSSLTAWDTRIAQVFELDIAGVQGAYSYRLEIQHDLAKPRCVHEHLKLDGRTLYVYEDGEAHLFRDNGSEGPRFPADWSRSLIATIPARNDNRCLMGFRDRMRQIYLFSPDPRRMLAQSDREEEDPDPSLFNLVSWLRHLQAEDSSFASRLELSLRELLPGFTRYSLKSVGETERKLRFSFTNNTSNASEFVVPFDEVSDGQRMLTALYIILEGVFRPHTTICLDEPDNFVALRELQPWILQAQERQENINCQVLIASHHPEFINYQTPLGESMLFSRDSAGPVRVAPFPTAEDDLEASEIMARGWELA